MSKVKEMIVETASGSKYRLLRESGSMHTMWLVSKVETPNKISALLCFGNARKLTQGPIAGGAQLETDQYIERVGGDTTELIEVSAKEKENAPILMNQMFFSDTKLFAQKIADLPDACSFAHTTQRTGGLTPKFRNGLGWSGPISSIIDVKYL